MALKKKLLILTIIILFASIIAVSASDYQQNINDVLTMLENTDESDLTGCCSVVMQLDGNNSMMSFRRDANLTADISIEKIDWHGKQAIKQYKTNGGYFCQVIITNDGWMIGYGGVDDGIDNERIENITAGMITNDNSIPQDGLNEIQQIKAAYKLGHVLIKAPNGNYGIATATNNFTGKLDPGDYVSIPNRYSYFRSGNISLNTTDKVKVMDELAISDMFGITRRDVTVYDFECMNNSDNVTKVYLSNDDGSMYNMNSGGLCDNVNFLGNVTHAEDIPIAPKYMYLGNVTFEGQGDSSDTFNILIFAAIAVFIIILFFLVLHAVRVIRYRRKYRRR